MKVPAKTQDKIPCPARIFLKEVQNTWPNYDALPIGKYSVGVLQRRAYHWRTTRVFDNLTGSTLREEIRFREGNTELEFQYEELDTDEPEDFIENHQVFETLFIL